MEKQETKSRKIIGKQETKSRKRSRKNKQKRWAKARSDWNWMQRNKETMKACQLRRAENE